MNSHIVPSEKIAKLKRLSLEIEELRSEFNTFGWLKPKKTLKLTNKENKLQTLIKSL